MRVSFNEKILFIINHDFFSELAKVGVTFGRVKISLDRVKFVLSFANAKLFNTFLVHFFWHRIMVKQS